VLSPCKERESKPCNSQCHPDGSVEKAADLGPIGFGTARASQARMTDVLLVLATAAFFGLSWGYARICEKL
jgi:hypothetical protein